MKNYNINQVVSHKDFGTLEFILGNGNPKETTTLNTLGLKYKLKTASGINNNFPSILRPNLFKRVVKGNFRKLRDKSYRKIDPFLYSKDVHKSHKSPNENEDKQPILNVRVGKYELYTFNKQHYNNINNKIKYCIIFLNHIFQNTFISTPQFKLTSEKMIITIYYYCRWKESNNINLSLLQVEDVLSNLFNINIKLRFIKLHSPFFNSTIFGKFFTQLFLGNLYSNRINKNSKPLPIKRFKNKHLQNFKPYKRKSFKTKTKRKIRLNTLLRILENLKLIRSSKRLAAKKSLKFIPQLINKLKYIVPLDIYTVLAQTKLLNSASLKSPSEFTASLKSPSLFSSGSNLQKTKANRTQFIETLKFKSFFNIFEKYRSRLGLAGIKFQIAGRMKKKRTASRAALQTRSKGYFKFNSKNSLIDHSRLIYKNKNGSFSVKIWISGNNFL